MLTLRKFSNPVFLIFLMSGMLGLSISLQASPLSLCFLQNFSRPAVQFEKVQLPKKYQIYLNDTRSGLEKMRNPESGLVRDKIQIIQKNHPSYSVKVMNDNTSATNIGLDIINLLSAPENSNSKLNQILTTLEAAPYHTKSGLFYSWYSTKKGTPVVNSDVSSVDNIHLALGLWTLAETQNSTTLGRRAQKLFERMDFSIFYDKSNGLLHGNLKHENGTWRLEDYHFANLGSEARSIYALSYALGLFRSLTEYEIRAMPARSIASIKAEFFEWSDHGSVRKILRTWDGGAFQLLLPKLLLNEEIYSPILSKVFKNYSDYTISEGNRQGIQGLAYHSASQYGFDNHPGFEKVPAYHGKAGSPELVSTDHADIKNSADRALWDLTMTPHAAVLAATSNPQKYGPILGKIESLSFGSNRMYQPGLGFMDGYHLKGAYKGQVVPVQISLDQGMIVLALDQMAASDGLSTSGRALKDNSAVHKKLQLFYGLLDQKLSPHFFDGSAPNTHNISY